MIRKTLSLLLALALLLALPAQGAMAQESRMLPSRETQYSYQVTTAQAQARLAGGTDYLDKYGVTRAKIVAELTAHEHDNFYLGTPFVGGDWQSPNGDTSYNGAPGTNCAGFVAAVLRRCGLNTAEVFRTMQQGRFTKWGSGKIYDGLSSASNYMILAEKGHIVSYAYPSKAAMLAGGKAEKGDIVLRFWTDNFGGNDIDNHLMIYWGNTPSEDKVWQNSNGCVHIGTMREAGASSFILIKFAPAKPPAPLVAGFRDVYESDWYAKAVFQMKFKGLMSGVSEISFGPNENISRAQLTAILWRLADRPEGYPVCEFADVDRTDYYCRAVDWAYATGITAGKTKDNFAPNEGVTRQELAAFLYRFCNSSARSSSMYENVGGRENPAAYPVLAPFEDAVKINDFAVPAMGWAVEKELIHGVDEKHLDPKSVATRAQTAQVIMMLAEMLNK